jgi:hypothetical protein
MFLVEPESGPRCHYASSRALGAAIRRGELGPKARIFHQATSQWLPITVHPEYRKAESEWEQANARRMSGRQWTFLTAPPETDTLDSASPSGQTAAGPMLIPGDGEPTWLRSAFRHLLQLARAGS